MVPSCLDVRSSSPSAVRLQIDPGQARSHRAIDQFPHGNAHPIAERAQHVQLLDLFDRRHHLRNPIVRLFHLGEIGGKQPSVLQGRETSNVSCSP
jgi:hypothetical protein